MSRQLVVVVLLMFSSLVGLVQPVEALTGNEQISATNVTTVSADISVTGLDTSDGYKWSIYIYYPTGSMCASDTGYWTQNVQTSMNDTAHWGPCIQAGNYSYSLRLYDYSPSQVLDYYNGTYYSNGTSNSSSQDSYEPNNVQSAAVQMQVNNTYSNLTMHSYSDEDWFWFNVTHNQNVWVNLTYSQVEQDCILWVYKDNGGGFKTTLGHSDGSIGLEEITFNSSTSSSTWRILVRVLVTSGTGGYNMSAEHQNKAPVYWHSPDQYEPNENANQSTTANLPFNTSRAGIHNSSDQDWYNFYATNGDRYWINASFTDSVGDLDMWLEDSLGNTLASSTSSTNDEQISWTANATGTFYVKLDCINNDITDYRLFISTNSTVPQPAIVTGDLDGGNLNLTSSWSYIDNVTTNASYNVTWSLTRWNGGNVKIEDSGNYIWNASNANSTDNRTLIHAQAWISESWCIAVSLEGTVNTTTLQLDSFIDCWTPSFVNANFTTDWQALVHFTDLILSSNLFYSWSMRSATGANIHNSGNVSLSTNSTGATTTSISWPYLSQGANCLWGDIWAANGTLIEHQQQCFTPTLPIVNFTAFDNTSIGVMASQLLNSGPWRLQVEVETFAGTLIHTTSNRTWTGSSDQWENWSWTPLNTSGWYCAIAYLYSQNGSLWDQSETCIQLNFDDDGDGVLNEDDWCNNTLPGYTVDANGCADYQKDTDSDGYTDDIDAFPWDHTEWNDTDSDGYGDNSDAFPSDNQEWNDTDGDGHGDNGDVFPFDQYEWADSDNDGCGDNGDAFPFDNSECLDSDEDGVGDNSDAFPFDVNEWNDTDSDGYGDNSDAFPGNNQEWNDTDGDGYGDNGDAFPSDVTEWADSDGDFCGDNSDVYPNNANECLDSDSDGIGDNSDICPNTEIDALVDISGCDDTQRDTDQDGIKDAYDSCPATPSGENPDSNGCSSSQRDTDEDTITDNLDLCPNTINASSIDLNGCSDEQRDSDDDGVKDANDLCPATQDGASVNLEGCAASERDSDEDGYLDSIDSCPSTPIGEVIDFQGCAESQKDSDTDGINNAIDQCTFTPVGQIVDSVGCSDSQRDSDLDGVNDMLDDFPNDVRFSSDKDGDGVADELDDYPLDASRSVLEPENSDGLLITLVVLVAVGIVGIGFMLYRQQSGVEIVEKSYSGPSEWVDEDGVSWSRSDDGSVYYWDKENQNWALSK